MTADHWDYHQNRHRRMLPFRGIVIPMSRAIVSVTQPKLRRGISVPRRRGRSVQPSPRGPEIPLRTQTLTILLKHHALIGMTSRNDVAECHTEGSGPDPCQQKKRHGSDDPCLHWFTKPVPRSVKSDRPTRPACEPKSQSHSESAHEPPNPK